MLLGILGSSGILGESDILRPGVFSMYCSIYGASWLVEEAGAVKIRLSPISYSGAFSMPLNDCFESFWSRWLFVVFDGNY